MRPLNKKEQKELLKGKKSANQIIEETERKGKAMNKQATLFIQSTLTPLIAYPGSKGGEGVWQKIVSQIPQCDLFIEAMCGSALISSILKNCSIVANDKSADVVKQIQFASDRIRFTTEDYQEVIKRYDNGNARRVFYFDPPYLMATRGSNRPLYQYEWNAGDHKRFLSKARAMKCPALISHYPCKEYDTALKTWRKITYTTTTRAGAKKERLYMNFPPPALLQCADHCGDDFTDRQRIKRKAESLVNRLKNTPDGERAAILTKLIAAFTYIAAK